ncbi:MAG: hypothetical protein A3D95_14900 [Betaproteobacteria bacterium RIFCSPHIGHO2_12_FULL_69_13]|nr:MAG: hypothetical protein A3D95_14900 [Betaproteobacteria bacterium RIFCSPHIGHO2_12_FULL_69_13]OGA65541.1 MAG: hypothetical protein A3G83_04620 [Betaproteobacteria bacterium RIFCSPLOWO2_12_FULL_68_20]
MRSLIIALFAAGLPLAAAQAQPQSDIPDADSAFKALDKNGDGFLSPSETSGERELAKRFERFDANRDGRLDTGEWRRAVDDNQKRVLSDSAITTKVKAELLAAKGIPSMSISVSTYEGRVQLSGFVETKEQVARAGKLAGGVSGVKSVQNALAVK